MQLVGLVVPGGFEVNSFAPLSVLEAANTVLGEVRYAPRLVSEFGGPVRGALGIEVATQPMPTSGLDTLLVAGAGAVTRIGPRMADRLRQAQERARRLAAIRLGAFALAEAGLLDGRRATTHWTHVDALRRAFPAVTVDAESIFVEDGPIWTSAGMTAGVDLALSMVERDIGPEAAHAVMQHLVLGERRAAGCRQRPDGPLRLPRSDRVQRAIAYARANLRAPLTVEALAEAACLSPRQFGRVFLQETGLSPARAVEKLRLEAARLLISQGRLAIETIADETGFGDAGRMRRAFQRAYDRSPSALRRAAGPRVNV